MSDELEVSGDELHFGFAKQQYSGYVTWERGYGLVYCVLTVDGESIANTTLVTELSSMRRWVSRQKHIDSDVRLKVLRDIERIEAQYHEHCLSTNQELPGIDWGLMALLIGCVAVATWGLIEIFMWVMV